MESEWIEYDSAGYPHKREQQRGEASRRRFGMFIHDSTCAVFTLDNKTHHVCDCGHAVPVQTEGGEKPKSPCCHLTMRDDTAFYTCSCGRHWIPVELSLPTKWREIESASPPAQPAGGAREWLKEHSAVFTGMDDIEYVAGHMERYAAQVSKSEREARERAEKALRELQEKMSHIQKWGHGSYGCHVAPDRTAIEVNKGKEPEGERIRAELEDFLTRNGIVGVTLDTEQHVVRVDIAKLPPNIKSVLTIWGSIFVKDES